MTFVSAASILLLLCCLYTDVSAFSPQPKHHRLYLAQNTSDESNLLITETSPTKTLIRALERAEYAYQRRNAAIWLGERGAKEAIPHLLRALKDPEEVVKSGAAKALALIGEKSAHATIFEELIANLADPDPQVRQYSAYVLGQFGKKAGKKDPEIIEALENIAQDENGLVRVEVIYALYEIGSPSSENFFIQALLDEEPRVRQYAATALAEIKTTASTKALAGVLKNETEEDIRGIIVTALGKHGSANAVAALLAALPRETEPVKAQIAAKLGDAKTPAAIEALANLMLSDPSPRVRANAANSLHKIKDPSTVPALASALKDRSPMVRIPASSALIGLADDSVLDNLIDALGDNDGRVANNAAEALVRLGNLNAIHKLILLVDSPNQKQRNLAIELLEAITYRDFGPNTKKWREWYRETFGSGNKPPVRVDSG